jgi:hypothetical protein
MVLAAGLLLVLAEGYLRLFPPRDLHQFLGEESPLTDVWKADPDFGVTYRDWDAFAAQNAERLAPYLPLKNNPDARPTWAFFGNSFVQAPGMLADHARARVTDHRIFNLGRNELLQVRFAQVKLLLEHGLEPERIFVTLMPPDLLLLGPHPLQTMHVTARGAITYTPRPQLPAVDWLVRHSRLALTALVRSKRHQGNPRFNGKRLYEHIDPILLADLRYLFGNLAKITRAHNSPVTVILIPGYHQIARGDSFNFQDTLAPMFRELGFDVHDPREVFCSHPDPESLFIPDRHFNDAGNKILLNDLLRHLKSLGKGGYPVTDRSGR